MLLFAFSRSFSLPLWDPSSYRTCFLICLLSRHRHSDEITLMATFQWLKPPAFLDPQGLAPSFPPKLWTCDPGPHSPPPSSLWLWWHCRTLAFILWLLPWLLNASSSYRWSPGPQVLHGHGSSLHTHSHRSLTYFTASTITSMSESGTLSSPDLITSPVSNLRISSL